MSNRQYKVHYLDLSGNCKDAIVDFENDGYWFYDEKCSYSDNLLSIVAAIADYGFCKICNDPEAYVLANRILKICAFGNTENQTKPKENKEPQKERQNTQDAKTSQGKKRNRRTFYKFNEPKQEPKQEPNHTSTFTVNDGDAKLEKNDDEKDSNLNT